MSKLISTKRLLLGAVATAVIAAGAAYAQDPDARLWIRAGQGGMLDREASFDNALGKLGIVNASGPIDMKGHPFFEPIGTNGRACVTCHQRRPACAESRR